MQITFRCFGAWIIPEGADGAGNWLAFGYQSDSVEPDFWALTLMSRDAWLEGWMLAARG